MQVQINAQNSVDMSERMQKWARGQVEGALERFVSQLSRVEVHLKDTNGDKGGVDKQCTVEARPHGAQPFAAQHEATTFELALDGALDKIARQIEKNFEKIDHKKGRTPFGGEPFATSRDTVDEEEAES